MQMKSKAMAEVPREKLAIPRPGLSLSASITGRALPGNVFLGGNPPAKGVSMGIRTLAFAVMLGAAS